MLVLRHLVREEGGTYRPAQDALDVLRFYANSVTDVVDRGAPAR
jgi:hypothetical protein